MLTGQDIFLSCNPTRNSYVYEIAMQIRPYIYDLTKSSEEISPATPARLYSAGRLSSHNSTTP